MKYNDAISFVIMCVFLHRLHFKIQKISMRSQKLCLTIPKMLPDIELSTISTNSNYQATFLGSFLRSQKLCLTINCPSSLLKTIVRQNFWDLFWDPKKLCLTGHEYSYEQLIVRQHFWDPRNYAWQLSGNIFGMVRHHFWDLTLIFRVQKEARTG